MITLLKMAEDNITDMDEILKRVKNVENTILQFCDQRHERREFVPKEVRKYCNYHQTTTHSNSECMSQRKYRFKSGINKGKEVKAMSEINKDNSCYFRCFVKPRNLYTNILCDTGSTRTFVDSDLCKAYNVPTFKIPPITAKAANGDERECTEACILTLINDRAGINEEIQCVIYFNLTPSIILGTDYLSKLGCVISLKEKTLQIKQSRMCFNIRHDLKSMEATQHKSNGSDFNEDSRAINYLLEKYRVQEPLRNSIPNQS